MSAVAVPVEQAFFHYVGLAVGALAVITLYLDLRLLKTTDSAFFTSRAFLKREETLQQITYIIYVITFAFFTLTASHFSELFLAEAYLTSFMTALTSLSLIVAVLLAFYLKDVLANETASLNE